MSILFNIHFPDFDIETHLNLQNFYSHCKQYITIKFIEDWHNSITNVDKHPKLRTYSRFKTSFYPEPYLNSVKELKYRNAISKIRTSSHTLAIERGRYTRPKTPIEQRLCEFCDVIEDEEHFLVACQSNQSDRNILFEKIQSLFPCFSGMSLSDKFIFLMTIENDQVMKWLGIFIHKSFSLRSTLMR